ESNIPETIGAGERPDSAVGCREHQTLNARIFDRIEGLTKGRAVDGEDRRPFRRRRRDCKEGRGGQQELIRAVRVPVSIGGTIEDRRNAELQRSWRWPGEL